MSFKIPKYIYVAVSAWLSRGISAFIQLISIRLFLDILGNEYYAVFVLMSVLIVWSTLADFGIGQGLQNYISELKARNVNYESYIISAIALSSLIVLVLLVIFYFTSGLLSELYLVNFSHLDFHQKSYFYILLFMFILSNYGMLIYKIWYGEHEGWRANLLQSIISVASFLILMFIYLWGENKDLLFISVMFYLPNLLIPLIFLANRLSRREGVRLIFLVDKRIMISIFRRSFGFFILLFLSVSILQADYIVISQKLTADEILIYTVLLRIFGLVIFFYTALLNSIWPICIEYRIQKKWNILNKMVVKYISVGLVCAFIVTCFIFLFQNELFYIISPNLISYNIPTHLFILFGIYLTVRIWVDTYSMLLQSMNEFKVFYISLPIQAVLNLALQFYLVNLFGMSGVLVSLIISFLFTVAISLPVSYYSLLKIKNNTQ